MGSVRPGTIVTLPVLPRTPHNLTNNCTVCITQFRALQSVANSIATEAPVGIIKRGPFITYRLVGLEVRRPPREWKIPGSNPACAGILSGSSHTSDFKKLAFQWLPCQAPGVTGSALGLVGTVSVYCDWVIWKVGSATSVSVWQHVKLSVQIRP